MNRKTIPDFAIEFDSRIPNVQDELRPELEKRLTELAKGHKDIVGASAVVEELASNRETPFVYRARVVVFIRPENIAADEKADTPQAALKGALDAVVRQVRQRREKLGKPWRRTDRQDRTDQQENLSI